MKKSEWLDCQGNEFFPKQKGTPSLVKIEHKNTATLDSARSKKKKKSKVAVLQLGWHEYTPGAQWLSGRVLDSRPKGRGFEPHRRHCVVVLEQDTFILA